MKWTIQRSFPARANLRKSSILVNIKPLNSHFFPNCCNLNVSSSKAPTWTPSTLLFPSSNASLHKEDFVTEGGGCLLSVLPERKKIFKLKFYQIQMVSVGPTVKLKVCSDEGLTLKTSVQNHFHGVKLIYINLSCYIIRLFSTPTQIKTSSHRD